MRCVRRRGSETGNNISRKRVRFGASHLSPTTYLCRGKQQSSCLHALLPQLLGQAVEPTDALRHRVLLVRVVVNQLERSD